MVPSTGIKRVVEGEIKMGASKTEKGKLVVKYTIPLTPETKYSVLATDYDSYAVLWSCSGIGPFHTQNAWIMTRERQAPNPVLQKVFVTPNWIIHFTNDSLFQSSKVNFKKNTLPLLSLFFNEIFEILWQILAFNKTRNEQTSPQRSVSYSLLVRCILFATNVWG